MRIPVYPVGAPDGHRPSVSAGCWKAFAVAALLIARAQAFPAALDNGVDPYHLGKGDWLWVISTCESAIGSPGNLQALINFEKAKGMQYLIVKCADGGQYGPGYTWAQFNSDLVTRCHDAGMKIFGFGYVYGSSLGSGQVQGEINAAVACMGINDSHGVPMDGFMIDAEAEYNGQSSEAIAYCQGIRTAYAHRFLAHSPYPIPSNNVSFPYIEFGQYCDAVFPQDYWYDQFHWTGGITPEDMLSRQNDDFIYWQGVWTSNGHASSVKPLVPIGQGFQGYSPVAIPGSELTRFYNSVKSASPCATAGGYQGISFWSCQHHTTDMWNAIGAMSFPNPPVITNQPASLVCTQGGNASFSVLAGPSPLTYQWQKDGGTITGATASTFTRSSVTINDAAGYTVLVSGYGGSVTSDVATLTVLVGPGILDQPESAEVLTGHSTNFGIAASGSLPLTYQWRWNNIPILTGTAATNSGNQFNAGSYWCIVSNRVNMITSDVVTLSYLYPPFITNQPRSAVVPQNTCTNFVVGAGGTTPLYYQWHYNTALIVISTAADSGCEYSPGSYSVVVSNRSGLTVTSTIATLSILYPVTNALPGHFDTITRQVDGAVVLSMSGTPGTNYTLLWTADWLSWPSLGTLPSGSGQFQYTDTSATNAGLRFYRLRLGQ